MVSVGVTKLGFTDLIFVDPGVKVNGSLYRDVVLSQKLLPVMREVSGEFFIFQQDSAPAHRACDRLLSDFWSRQRQRSFPQICGLRTAPT